MPNERPREINMLSDTVTRPTPAMREAIANAVVGDDMTGEDPTVNHLEEVICRLLDKEAALFACSGSQSNQMAIKAHCQPGDDLLIEATGHIARFEAGGPAALAGVTVRTINGRNGMLDVSDIEGMIHADNQHLTITRLICIENTTNMGGGHVYPVEQIDRICEWAHANNLQVHLDGARLMNAVVASGETAKRICQHVDSVSMCFSKGLGCPMGSILAGPKELIAKARRVRKLLGGALRQSGIVAAAAVHALEHHVERLRDDHANARWFAEQVTEINGILIDPSDVKTNLVFFEIDPNIATAAEIVDRLSELGVRMGVNSLQRIRACTHLDVSRSDMQNVVEALHRAMEIGVAPV